MVNRYSLADDSSKDVRFVKFMPWKALHALTPRLALNTPVSKSNLEKATQLIPDEDWIDQRVKIQNLGNSIDALLSKRVKRRDWSTYYLPVVAEIIQFKWSRTTTQADVVSRILRCVLAHVGFSIDETAFKYKLPALLNRLCEQNVSKKELFRMIQDEQLLDAIFKPSRADSRFVQATIRSLEGNMSFDFIDKRLRIAIAASRHPEHFHL